MRLKFRGRTALSNLSHNLDLFFVNYFQANKRKHHGVDPSGVFVVKFHNFIVLVGIRADEENGTEIQRHGASRVGTYIFSCR